MARTSRYRAFFCPSSLRRFPQKSFNIIAISRNQARTRHSAGVTARRQASTARERAEPCGQAFSDSRNLFVFETKRNNQGMNCSKFKQTNNTNQEKSRHERRLKAAMRGVLQEKFLRDGLRLCILAIAAPAEYDKCQLRHNDVIK
nr:hypothetical protein [Chromobacterium sp. ASV5]